MIQLVIILVLLMGVGGFGGYTWVQIPQADNKALETNNIVLESSVNHQKETIAALDRQAKAIQKVNNELREKTSKLRADQKNLAKKLGKDYPFSNKKWCELNEEELTRHGELMQDFYFDCMNKFLNKKGYQIIYTYNNKNENTGITSLLQSIRDEGIKLKDINTEKNSLESIFVNLVKGSNNELARR